MQYDATTPAEYMAQLDDDWRREKIEQLRVLIKTQAPFLTEDINYKMLGYGDANGRLFHLNAQKNYVSLYVGDAAKVDPDGASLAGLNVGKGCIRFTKSVSIPATWIMIYIVAFPVSFSFPLKR